MSFLINLMRNLLRVQKRVKISWCIDLIINKNKKAALNAAFLFSLVSIWLRLLDSNQRPND